MVPSKRDSLKQCITKTFSNENVNQEETKVEEDDSVVLAPML